MDLKICIDCGCEFDPPQWQREYGEWRCRPCLSERKVRWAREDKKKNPEKYRKINRDRQRNLTQDQLRRKHLVSKYGITPEDYDQMLERQDYRCAICRAIDPGGHGGRFFHVDHCHRTGRVRGLLCMQCNHGIGNFRDSVDIAVNAASYLSYHSMLETQDS